MTGNLTYMKLISQSQVDLKNNPGHTKFKVKSGFTDLEMSFRERLIEKLKEKNLKPAELARRSGVSKQNIGRIINNTPHSITGALPKTAPETIEKIARALEWDLDEALLAGGYAPVNQEDSLDNQLRQLSPQSQKIARKQISAIIKTFVEADSISENDQNSEDLPTLEEAIAEDKDD
jgi:transcriptional regulator with XRE-family HTH domain